MWAVFYEKNWQKVPPLQWEEQSLLKLNMIGSIYLNQVKRLCPSGHGRIASIVTIIFWDNVSTHNGIQNAWL